MLREFKAYRPMRVFRIMRKMNPAWAKENKMLNEIRLNAPHPGIVWCSKLFVPDVDEKPGIVWFRAMGDNRKVLGLIR